MLFPVLSSCLMYSVLLRYLVMLKKTLCLKDICVNCFYASSLRTQIHMPHVMHRAMIGQMAIAIALLGINDLRSSVTPTFLFRNRFYLLLSPHCPKVNKKSMWEVKKNSIFLSTGHGILPSCGCKERETMVAKCELVL